MFSIWTLLTVLVITGAVIGPVIRFFRERESLAKHTIRRQQILDERAERARRMAELTDEPPAESDEPAA